MSETRQDLGMDVHGACGEVAVSAYLRVPLDCTIDKFMLGDDQGGVQVRTAERHCYNLIVRPRDFEGHSIVDVFVLVTAEIAPMLKARWADPGCLFIIDPAVVIQGWTWLGEVKDVGKWIDTPKWREQSPFWMVPQNKLLPPELLLEERMNATAQV